MYPSSHRLRALVALLAVGIAIAGGVSGGAVAANDSDVTFVEADVTADTTWNESDGPYRVIRDVRVSDGATLTIEPGTEIQFADDRTIVVAGSLRATGTADDPISFETTPGASDPVRWNTLRYEGGEGTTFSLANATVRDARTGITVASGAGAVTLRDTTVRDVSQHGLAVTATATAPDVEVSGSTFKDVGGHGIAATPSSGALESISLAASTNALGETGGHTVTLEPGVEVTADEFALAYGGQGDVRGAGLSDIGVDSDGDGDLDRSFGGQVTDVTRTDGTVRISLSESVRVRGGERLVLGVTGVRNPATRGIYRVGVSATADGVQQLADGVFAPLNVGGVTEEYADTTVVEPTAVEGLSVHDTVFEDVEGAGLRVEANTVNRLRFVDNDVSSVGGEGIGMRATKLGGLVSSNRIVAEDAGIRVAVRDGVSRLRVVQNRVTGSDSGLAVRQSGSRVRATMVFTVERNTFADNDRRGIDVHADRGRWTGGTLSENRIQGNDRAGAVLTTSGIHDTRIESNEITENGGDGLKLRTGRLGSTAIHENTVTDNAGTGLAIDTRASARSLSIRNATVQDNGGHGIAVHTDLVAHELTLVESTVSNNAGAGLLVTSPLTHGGSVDVRDNILAANSYGVHVAGALQANLTRNAIVYNTNRYASPVPIDGVEPGTAISITEGDAGVVVDRGDASVALSELVADPRVNLQLEAQSPFADTAVVLRTDGQGHTRYEESAALPIDSILSELPTGVALSTREDAGVSLDRNDVYDHPRGVVVDVETLIDANTTARLLVEDLRTVSAEDTYWGADTGPFHDSIWPSGEGDAIETRAGWIDFVPYATSPFGDRYERPVPQLSAPETALPDETVTFDGRNSRSTSATITRFYFEIDGSRIVVSSPTVDTTMTETPLDARLEVEDELGIDSSTAFGVTVEVAQPPTTTPPTTTTTPTTTTEAAPVTTPPGPDRSGPLGTFITVLGGMAILVALLLGGYGMYLTLQKRNPPYDGRIVHAVAMGGVVVWILGGLLLGGGLVRLGVATGVAWAVLTGVAYAIAIR